MNSIISIFYIVFLTLLVIFSFFFVDPNFMYIKFPLDATDIHYRSIAAVFYVVCILLFYLLYGVILLLVHKKIMGKKKIILLLVSTGILSLAYPAMLSYDIFNYIATAKVAYFYHENPYVIMPIEFVGDPVLTFTRAANKIALYGPAWIILTAIPYLVGFGNYLLLLVNIKILVGLFFVGTCVLIWKITKDIKSVAFFGFHPLVVIETLVSGHNDIVMMFFVLLAYFLLMRKKIFLTLLFLGISIGIKYASIILLPFFLYIVLNNRRNRQINWNKIFLWSSIAMLSVLLLGSLREEIYSWYAIWVLIFAVLIYRNKEVFLLYQAFSIGLLLSYVPYLSSGTYSGVTPLLKTLTMLLPPFIVGVYLLWQKKLWLYRKIFSFL